MHIQLFRLTQWPKSGRFITPAEGKHHNFQHVTVCIPLWVPQDPGDYLLIVCKHTMEATFGPILLPK